jgi:hypothetical protein
MRQLRHPSDNTNLFSFDDVADNEIGDKGFAKLDEALRGNSTLKELSLRGKRILVSSPFSLLPRMRQLATLASALI